MSDDVTRLDTVNVTKPCRACGVDVVTSHSRIPVCAGCRSRGLAGVDDVKAFSEKIADAYAALGMFDTGSGASVADLINELRKMWGDAEARVSRLERQIDANKQKASEARYAQQAARAAAQVGKRRH